MDLVSIELPAWLFQGLILVGINVIVVTAIPTLRYLYRLTQPDYLLGSWTEHHWTFAGDLRTSPRGEPRLLSSRWAIKRGFRHRYRIVVERGHQAKVKYSGNMLTEKGHLVLEFERPNESVFYRLEHPVPDDQRTEMLGIWLSYDFRNQIACGVSLLEKGDASATADDIGLLFEQLTKELVDNPESLPLMRLNR